MSSGWFCELLFGNPGQMEVVPGRLAGVAPSVAEQQLTQLVSSYPFGLLGVVPRSHQIADRFGVWVGYKDRDQFTVAEVLCELYRITLVVLNALTGLLGN
jgi:hypothetical protein